MNTRKLLELAVKAADPDSILTKEERAEALKTLQQALLNDNHTQWWVILLKVLAYAIGLILAGYGTTAATLTIFPTLLG